MSDFGGKVLHHRGRDYGFWSPTTASTNFCEENYATSFYVAEFVNTISNLAYVYYAYNLPNLSLPSRKVAPPASERHRSNDAASMVLDIHTLPLLAIGLTSAIFHLTLRHIPQLLNETSILLLIAGFAFELLTTFYTTSTETTEDAQPAVNPSLPFWQSVLVTALLQSLSSLGLSSLLPRYPFQSTRWELVFAWILSACVLGAGSTVWRILVTRSHSRDSRAECGGSLEPRASIEYRTRSLSGGLIVFTLLYATTFTLYVGDLTMHSIFITFFVLVGGCKAVSMIRQHEPKTRFRLYKHLLSACMTLSLAFALWLIDCSPSWCNFLRDSREQLIDLLPSGIGVVLGLLTELHGWWHILTARAAGEFISLIRYITRNLPAPEDDTDEKV